MRPPTAHPEDDRFRRDRDFEHVIERHQCTPQRFGLRQCPRETVEEITARAVCLLQPVLDQSDDDVVGHQRSGGHHLLRSESEWRSRGHRSAQHVAGGNLRNSERFRDERGLRAFARARRAQQYQSHVRRVFLWLRENWRVTAKS